MFSARYLPIIGLLLILLAACNTSRSDPAAETEPTPVRLPTAQITSTPIRVKPLIINGPFPSPTPACENNSLPTRLIVGERGRVSDADKEPLNVREGPGTTFSILSTLKVDETFLILEGPTCSERYIWYRVTYRDQREGWIAEGDANLYFVEPYFPG